jgi:hypothetical protein
MEEVAAQALEVQETRQRKELFKAPDRFKIGHDPPEEFYVFMAEQVQ